MSKPNFVDGICLNSDHIGLLSVVEDRLDKLIKKEPITNVYNVEHTPFARGKFATVRKCSCPRGGGEFAAKFIRKRRRAADQRQDIVHEVAVLRLAADRCARIVALRDVFETPSEMALVLEMASGGELQYVLDQEESLEEVQASRIMRQILEGLTFLHDHNIAHLDLKPQNLLLTGAYPNCDVKLCDFGISRVICNGVEVREILGTPDYVAPEVLNYEPISLATDIWSVGVLAYVLLTGYSPFGGDTKQETFCNITQGELSFPDELFEGISSSAKDFISATLVKNPRRRLSTQDCLAHPWLCGAFIHPSGGDERLIVATRTDGNDSELLHNGEVKYKRCCSEIHFTEQSEMMEQNGHSYEHETLQSTASSKLEGDDEVRDRECKEADETQVNQTGVQCHECGNGIKNEDQFGVILSNGVVHEKDCNGEIARSDCVDGTKQVECSEEVECNGCHNVGEINEANSSSSSRELTNYNGTTDVGNLVHLKGSSGVSGCDLFVHNKVISNGLHPETTKGSSEVSKNCDEREVCEKHVNGFRKNDDIVDVNLFVGLRNTVKGCTKSVPGLNIEDELYVRGTKEHNGDVGNSNEIEIDEEGLPVKRSKNCCRRSSYPVSSCASCAQCKEQCCHLHPTPTTDILNHIGRQHRITSISSPPVEITVDRGITC
ncbi:calcium/calmodulin-dependent protein kinase cmkB-like [Schistocerca piceifrons]|uniref:calcium/calmodulin-dependent protein kinase cmkB-like n=1 Tax=Schistocerca piceifrons TaxID=274613 RepID=UPI001F5E4ED1|nr:calcium/calmodulin-dependent protein kinase cmkB-like [Schistocerca piceifrons]